MKKNFNKIRADKVTAIIIPFLLFAVSFLYLLIFRNSLFFYQENTSMFIYTHEYLLRFTNKPGGLLEYIGNFVIQGYFSPVYGALVIGLVNVIFYHLLINTGQALGGRIQTVRFYALLPSVALLVASTDYEHFMHYNLGFLLVIVYFFLCIFSKKSHLQLSFLLLLPLFYYVTGSFAIIFACIYICWSILYNKGIYRTLIPVIILLVLGITFFIFRNLLFYQPVSVLTGYPLPFTDFKNISGFVLFISIYIILFPLVIRLTDIVQIRENILKISDHVLPVLVLFVMILLLIRFHNPDLVKIIELEKKVSGQDWDGIIKQQEESPVANVIAQYYYNIALSEKDLLCERIFHAPQDFGAQSLCLPRRNEYYNRSVHFYYTIGLINEARHLAYESMVAYGYRPGNIKMLIKTELINGNFRVAEKYLNDLKRTLHYRKWAEKYERMLYKPEAVRYDSEFNRKIMLLPGTDFFIRPDDRENINLLFMSNPANLKAFEYRLAWMLLEKDYKSAVNEIRMMKLIGYRTIPRHLEEAAVGYTNITKILPDLGGLSIRPEVENDFYEYGSAYNLYSNRKDILQEEMFKTGGKTLWYYLQFK